MKKHLPLLALQFAAAALFSQSLSPESINFLGGEVQSVNGSTLSFSTAEVAVQHVKMGSGWLTEGFQQAEADTTNNNPAGPTPNPGIPNCFTPGDGGLNDLFDPVAGLEALDPSKPIDRNRSSILIFNRWGEVVHSEKHYKEGGWDGGPLPAATYYYRLAVTYLNGDKDVFMGPVTILRE